MSAIPRRSKDSLLLGIDLGTTVLKTCVFHQRTGAVRAQSVQRLPVFEALGVGREQDMALVLRALRKSLRALQQEVGPDWRRIAGIGVASQGGSTLIVTRGGSPLSALILWNDGRAHTQGARVREQLPPKFWKKLALREVAPAGIARLLWLQEFRPDLFTDANLHAGAGDYLYFLLTGVWRQEAGSALQIGPYNARTGRLDASPLQPWGIPLSFFPPLRQGHATEPLCGAGAALLGSPEGIPVAGPYIDQEAGYHSAAASTQAPLHLSLGTAWVGNFRIKQSEAGYSPYQLVLPTETSEERLVIQPLLTGNVAWDWALRTCAGGCAENDLRKVEALLLQQPFSGRGLQVIPWMAQMNPFAAGAQGAGACSGLGVETTREDVLRATAAGMTFELRRVFEPLRGSGLIRHVVLTGGASKGAHFRKLIASLLSPLPVSWQEDSDLAGARGALVAFDGKAAVGRLLPVVVTDAAFHDEVCVRYSEYLTFFNALYGRLPEGSPYVFKGDTNARNAKGRPATPLSRAVRPDTPQPAR